MHTTFKFINIDLYRCYTITCMAANTIRTIYTRCNSTYMEGLRYLPNSYNAIKRQVFWLYVCLEYSSILINDLMLSSDQQHIAQGNRQSGHTSKNTVQLCAKYLNIPIKHFLLMCEIAPLADHAILY